MCNYQHNPLEASNQKVILSPEYTSLSSTGQFFEFFLKNKRQIEKDSLTNLKSRNFLWYFDPCNTKIEWISISEIVNNIIVEDFDAILDPLKIICGCVVLPFDSFIITPESSFYQENSLNVSLLGKAPATKNSNFSKAIMSNFQFFKEKKTRQKKHKNRKSKKSTSPKIKSRGRRPRLSSKNQSKSKAKKSISSKRSKRYRSTERQPFMEISSNRASSLRPKSHSKLTSKVRRKMASKNKENLKSKNNQNSKLF